MQNVRLPSIDDISALSGKYVLLRASLNVPIAAGVVQNRFRILRTLPTIQYLIAHGARVIVVGHIGREKTDTLRPVFEVLRDFIEVNWCDDVIGARATKMRNELRDGEILLLENLRACDGETANDIEFAQALARHADLFINDAFDVGHRAHASVVGVPKYLPSYFGRNFVNEYAVLQQSQTPAAPSLFILGGAKFETKLPLIEKYLKTYDHVFVGGALAHDVWKAHDYELGRSLVSEVDLSNHALINAANLLMPVDVTVQADDYTRITTPDNVKPTETIVDAGPKTVEMLEGHIAAARSILWNGPLGNYEKGFATTTERLAQIVADASAHSVIGGGDTVASIESLCLEDKFDFVSTAGGAMLEFLEKGTLPAVDAVIQR